MKAASYFLLLSMAVFLLPWACTKTLVSPVSAIAAATPTFTPTVVTAAPITISVTSANLYSVNGPRALPSAVPLRSFRAK